MTWGTDLWDQYDNIEKHTQSGLDLMDRYVKFVKERTEIEQAYAKQLRSLTKKFTRRGGKDEAEFKFTNHQAFQEVLTELNDYAGQREVVAENMTVNICAELTKILFELKQERKTHLSDAKKAQQNLEITLKQLETSKKRFEKEWKEAEKANQQAERVEQDSSSTKADVDKAKQHAHMRTHMADECKNDYAAQLQKYNKEQNQFYYSEIPSIFNNLQGLDEKRIRKLSEGYALFADTEKQVMPIITKCLDGISMAGSKTNEKQDSQLFIEQHKSGLVPPSDVDFEDCSQGVKAASSENALNMPKVRIKDFFNKRKHKPPPAEDFSHLPPEQRKKRLQQKVDDIGKELQKEMDQSEALEKMKGVYVKNAQLGDPSSLEPQILQTAQNVSRLKGDLAKYESWLNEAGGVLENISSQINNNLNSSAGSNIMAAPTVQDPGVYEDGFYEDFDDEEPEVPLGQCSALYSFDGSSEGTICIQEGEQLSVMEADQGDGWMRVRRVNGDEGYVPSTYIKKN
ncbi:cdc42-interacting protein 4 homolog isoform X2 [Clupea harengus]|uniref:Cdc42-interacting protein 4 homolog isoform X2 n=1 Tax=Clupea harengus TaxID=7950 RepID=A0A6P8F0D2_CLUHA|nr:cdc42-interacting protein 4 homolog isoform X2 [Clupea harengus]